MVFLELIFYHTSRETGKYDIVSTHVVKIMISNFYQNQVIQPPQLHFCIINN